MISHEVSRRDWLAGAAGMAPAGTARGQTRPAPASPVAIAHCRAYDATFDQALASALDRIGGVGSLVKGKTVTVKLNLTGNITRFPNRPDLPYRNDPAAVLSFARQIARAGATRIRLIESFFPAKQELELWARYGLDVNAINNVGCKVEWENTQNVGQARQYTRMRGPWGGYIFPAFDLNHSFADGDVYMSLSKLKHTGWRASP